MDSPMFGVAYLVTNSNQNYVGRSFLIGVGVRQIQHEYEGEKRNLVQFIKAGGGGGIGGFGFIGTFQKNGDGAFEAEDEVRKGDDGKPVRWLFAQLTVENWTERGSDIVGFGKLRKRLTTDYALQNFYIQDWLPDYWEEHPKDA